MHTFELLPMPVLLINHVAQQCAPVIGLAMGATPSVLEKVDLTLKYRQALFNLAFAIFSLEMKNCKELSSMPYQSMVCGPDLCRWFQKICENGR